MPKLLEDSLPPKWITVEDFEFICFNLAHELLEFGEPIPEYHTRDNSLLESALASPRNAYELASSSFSEQASILFYSLIKNHPFRNGNKRIAVMSLLVFLKLNDKWLEIKPLLLYDLANIVAESEPQEREYVLQKNSEIFEQYIVMPGKI